MNEKKVLTFDQACDYAGISKSFMYKLTSSRRVPHYKPRGKAIYFDREQLENWLLSNPVKTADKIESESMDYIIKSGNENDKKNPAGRAGQCET